MILLVVINHHPIITITIIIRLLSFLVRARFINRQEIARRGADLAQWRDMAGILVGEA